MTAAVPSSLREIPYNYTSFSDREIVCRLLGRRAWELLEVLRERRRTGRSARLLFEALGEIWVIERNPLLQDDLAADRARRASLAATLRERVAQIEARAAGNPETLELAAAARERVERFARWLDTKGERRRRIRARLVRATAPDNCLFDGFARVAHVTDATDWRVEYPAVVVTPASERETLEAVRACIELGLTVIPRGGGTGYTGGAVPLVAESAVVNTEKLDWVGEVRVRRLPGCARHAATLRAGAGAITARVAEAAERAGWVFAVDPTSQDASTIGGNVAMNAGGKKAVMWGTTLDNLVWWRMVTPDAEWLEVERLDHHLGKLQERPEIRFRIRRLAADRRTPRGAPEVLAIPSAELRRPGLGKDVTNKVLGGLPGVQKEGCDGLITSAEFVLHRAPAHQRTVCLEFYDTLGAAVPAICEVKAALDAEPRVALAGMEHLDERYLRAVRYAPKAARGSLPRMVLLADLAGDDEGAVADCASRVVGLVARRGAEGFVAASPAARRRFWEDRARTAAIAEHTNAFKINEDVVIPLERLAEYSAGIERINIEQSLANKLRMAGAVRATLDGIAPGQGGDEIEAARLGAARERVAGAERRWRAMLEGLDAPARAFLERHGGLEPVAGGQERLVDLLLGGALRVSYRESIGDPLAEIFSGRGHEAVRERLEATYRAVLASRIAVATHMHAGDGNVHTNIPVNSNDYQMLGEAGRVVERIMALARGLGGVISGEHGIGITKMQFMDPAAVEAFAAYKRRVDPEGRFNRGKLMPGSGLEGAYTPSLRLVEQEALLLEASELGELNDLVRHCLRCGKCKPVCTTHVPRANLLYSPRNKILAAGLAIEAFLYEEQTRRGVSPRHFGDLNDIADHCTVCHRCLAPCPVGIDFGEVTVRMREILRAAGKRRSSPAAWLSMAFLNATDPRAVTLLRETVVRGGAAAQRTAHRIARRLLRERRVPRATRGSPRSATRLVSFVARPLPARVAPRPLRALLGLEDRRYIPVLRDPRGSAADAPAVLYFPGCGSERLYSEIALATLAMLLEAGFQAVLPPGYLCCGHPQRSAGDGSRARAISVGNQVLLHRVASALRYLEIETVVVSCGTCIEQLAAYRLERIFPGSRLLDIHELLAERALSAPVDGARRYLYHDPCHSPIKTRDPLAVTRALLGGEVLGSDRCCGEAGTFAVARPDIAEQIRFSKAEVLGAGIRALSGAEGPGDGELRLVTSCPACQQGLARYRGETGLEPRYVVVELAERRLGRHWQRRLLEVLGRGGVERVML